MYDAAYMQSFYDSYGEREWQRFEMDAAARMNFLVHRHYLDKYVHAGDHVLEVGAGPGRFTIELAKLGAMVMVGDISPVQLECNRQHVAEAGRESAVTGREVMDIADLSGLADGQFDMTVCYGGALSYMFDRAGQAVDELLRVTKPGGYVLVSVMSLYGTLRRYLDGVRQLIDMAGIEDGLTKILETGNLSREINQGHPMHMFHWAELRSILEEHRGEVIDSSSANFLSVGQEVAMAELLDRQDTREAIIRAEINACSQPGAIDGGTHMIAVVRKSI